MENYGHYLQSEYLLRARKNQKYSLRAFARDLSISSAFLSQVINGKRLLSEASGLSVARKLEWDSKKTDHFLRLIRMKQCKDPELRSHIAQGLKDTTDFVDLEVEKFEVIANWVHFAIMELTRVRGFRADAGWIARRLGVTKLEARDAIRRLLAFGMIEKDSDSFRIVKNASVADVPSAAIRRFHKAHLDKAAKALDEIAFDKRHLSGITTAVNPEQLPLAIDMIKKFRRRLMKVLENGQKDAVYQISFQIIPLDKEATQ